MKKSKIKITGYKPIAIASLEVLDDPTRYEVVIQIPKIFKTIDEAYFYKYSAFVTKIENDVVIQLVDDTTREIIDTVHSNEHWKFQLKKIIDDAPNVVDVMHYDLVDKSFNELYERYKWMEKEKHELQVYGCDFLLDFD